MSIYAGLSLREVYIIHCKEYQIKSNSALLQVLPSFPDDFSSLHFLDISKNFLGPIGIKPLLPVIECCTSLSALDFSSQQLHKESIELICAILRTHPSVARINLSGNPLNITAGVVLLDFCRLNQNIEEVLLYNTQIRGTMFSTIQEQTRINREKKKALKEPKSSFHAVVKNSMVSPVGHQMAHPQQEHKDLNLALCATTSQALISVNKDVENNRNEEEKETKRKVPVINSPSEAMQGDFHEELPKKRISPDEFKRALLKADSTAFHSLFTSPSSSHPFLFNFNPLPVLNEVCDAAKHFFYDFQFPADDKEKHLLDNHIYECCGFKRLTDIYPYASLFPEDKNDTDPIELPESVASGFQWLFTSTGASIRTLKELKGLFLLSSPFSTPYIFSSSSSPFSCDAVHAIHGEEGEGVGVSPTRRTPELAQPLKIKGEPVSFDQDEKEEDSLLDANGNGESTMIPLSARDTILHLSTLRNGVFGMRFFINGAWKYAFADDFVPVDYRGVPLFTKPIISHLPSRTEHRLPSLKEGLRMPHRAPDSETTSTSWNGSGGISGLKSSFGGSNTSSVVGSRCSSRKGEGSKVPFEQGEPSSRVYLWPCLLEKILAKLLGGYNALDSSLHYNTDSPLYRRLSRDPMYEEIKNASVVVPQPTSCGKLMSYLTGGVSIVRQLHNNGFDADAWWKNLEALLDATPPAMAVAISRKPSKCISGIEPSWAYEICQARQVNGFRLVELRSHDSATSWHGSWSEESPEWDLFPSVEAILRRGHSKSHHPASHSSHRRDLSSQRMEDRSLMWIEGRQDGAAKHGAGDGLHKSVPHKIAVIPKPPAFHTSQKTMKFTRFWMPYVSFLNAFEDVHICRTFPDFHERVVGGEWNCRTAGGHIERERWYANPHFRLRLAKKAPCFIFLSLQDRCFASDCHSDKISFHIIKSPCFPLICPREENGTKVPPTACSQDCGSTLVFQPDYYEADSLYFESMLEAGDDYWIIPSTFTEGLLDRFTLRIATSSSFIILQETVQDNWFCYTVKGEVGTVRELPFGEVTSQILIECSSSQMGHGDAHSTPALAVSNAASKKHDRLDHCASTSFSLPRSPVHMQEEDTCVKVELGGKAKDREEGENPERSEFIVVKASRKLLTNGEKGGGKCSTRHFLETKKDRETVTGGGTPVVLPEARMRSSIPKTHELNAESTSYPCSSKSDEKEKEVEAMVTAFSPPAAAPGAKGSKPGEEANEGDSVPDVVPLSLLLLRSDEIQESRRISGEVPQDAVVEYAPFGEEDFAYLQGTVRRGQKYYIVCGVGCKLPEKSELQFHIWSSIPLSRVHPLPAWKRHLVHVHWGDHNTVRGVAQEGSGPWSNATNNPQVEVSPVRAGESLVVRMIVSQFSDRAGMPPGITLFAIRNKERRGEGIQGLVPTDRIMSRSVYVRQSWLEHVFYVDEDLDSLLLMPCLQPVGSKGSCAIEVYSEFSDVSVRPLVIRNLLL